MPKRTRSYSAWRLEKLSDPRIAADYLNAAIGDSREVFLKALRNVSQAQQVAKVAREAGVKRESLYRALSEQGNPTLDTLHSVLDVLGLKMEIKAKKSSAARPPRKRRATRMPGAHPGRRRKAG